MIMSVESGIDLSRFCVEARDPNDNDKTRPWRGRLLRVQWRAPSEDLSPLGWNIRWLTSSLTPDMGESRIIVGYQENRTPTLSA
jgi:hypothetical protein